MAGHYHCPSTHLGLGQPHMHSNVQCTHSLRSVHVQFIRDWVLLRGPVYKVKVTVCGQSSHKHMHTYIYSAMYTHSHNIKHLLHVLQVPPMHTQTVECTECPRLTCGQTCVLENLSGTSSLRESPNKVVSSEWRAALCSIRRQQTTQKYTHAHTPHTMYHCVQFGVCAWLHLMQCLSVDCDGLAGGAPHEETADL